MLILLCQHTGKPEPYNQPIVTLTLYGIHGLTSSSWPVCILSLQKNGGCNKMACFSGQYFCWVYALLSWTKITLPSTMKTLTLPAIMPHLIDSKVVLQFENPVHIILQFIKFRSGHIYSQLSDYYELHEHKSMWKKCVPSRGPPINQNGRLIGAVFIIGNRYLKKYKYFLYLYLTRQVS